jgi:hypothetical protein
MKQVSASRRYQLLVAMNSFTIITLAGLIGSCGGSSPSSPTASRPDTLAISPLLDALKLGETQTLSAVLISGDGSRRTISATWSSDAPEIVAVTPDGRVQGLKLGIAQIRATFDTMSAVAALRVVPDYSGIWTGEYHVLECVRISGDGLDVCKFELSGGVGTHRPLRIEVNQTGRTISGTFSFYTNTRVLLESGPVDGDIDGSNVLILSATTRSVDPTESIETVVNDWSSTLTGDRMSGRFTKIQTFRNIIGIQKLREECELMNVTRSS